MTQSSDRVLPRGTGALPTHRVQAEVALWCWNPQLACPTWLREAWASVVACCVIQVLPGGTWSCTCLQNSGRHGSTVLGALARVACLAMSSNTTSHHPGASWGDLELRLPTEFTQKQGCCAGSWLLTGPCLLRSGVAILLLSGTAADGGLCEAVALAPGCTGVHGLLEESLGT